MDYTEFSFTIEPYEKEVAEILIALLSEAGFDGFVENSNGFAAYTSLKNALSRVEQCIARIRTTADIHFTFKPVERQNWNALWESSFSPIIVDDTLAVIAPFHQLNNTFPYQIVIEPKMSFGTGHHETTYMMLQLILQTDCNDKDVLDMGCGTGILSILASKKGARKITAIDIDDWAIENTIENCQRNFVTNIEVLRGDVRLIPQRTYQLLFANINRNILLKDIPQYAKTLDKGGMIFLSGFYEEDLAEIRSKGEENGLSWQKQINKNGWTAMVMEKV
ncbi:MAG: 50S ribosomal protein L11 methyltransferase [Bacteroidales bacterium]|nr:50S ribosomal protein L11 methyltransferase [Bacteroidales bacterium]